MRKTLIIFSLSLLFLSSPVLASEDGSLAAGLLILPITFLSLGLLFVLPTMIFSLSILYFVFWVVMLIDLLQRDDNEFPESGKDPKVIWLIILLLTQGIGPFVYYFLVYKKIKRKK